MSLARTPIVPSLILISLTLLACGEEASPGPGTGGMGSGGVPAGGTSPGGASGSAGTPAAGTGGSGGSGMPAGLPASDMAADIMTFFSSGTYRNAPWRPETAAPRDKADVSPHDKVQVWMNAVLIDSLKNGRSGKGTEPKPDQFSMAVKEFYDAAGTAVVGRALIYRSGATADAASWVFACLSSAPERCGQSGAVADMLVYGKGQSGQECHFCHSPSLQTFFTPPPP